MIYFKFNSPLKARDPVETIVGNEKYDCIVFGDTDCCYIGSKTYHSRFCARLQKASKEYFAPSIRKKYLDKAGFHVITNGYFPEFPSLTELQRFLEFINDNYSEI